MEFPQFGISIKISWYLMVSQKHKRFFYIPGIISLLTLPFLFAYYGNNLENRLIKNVLTVYWYDPELAKEVNSDIFPEKLPLKRNYIDITLTNDNEQNKVKLDFSQIRLREILQNNDSINGIHYRFIDSSEYWTFVKALDICIIEGAKMFTPYENNLWVFHVPPDTTMQTWICGTPGIQIKEQPSWLSTLKEKALIVWLTSWHLILGFICLAVFSIRVILTGNIYSTCP